MQVTMIRHGSTAMNDAHRYCGRTDDPLSAAGLREAQLLGADESVKKVFVSPLLRARQTAAILFPEAEQVCVPGFAEMDFGAFEGKTAEELGEDPRYSAWVNWDCTAPCPEGESMDGFFRRVQETFLNLLEQEAGRGEEAVYILAHGGTIMGVMDAFAALPRPHYYDWHVKNLGGYTAQVQWERDHALSLMHIKNWR